MSLKGLLRKLKESFLSVFPITIIIFALVIFVVPTDGSYIIKLTISAILLILGISLFSLGADSAMIKLGNGVGSTLSKKNKLLFMIVCGFVIGFAITIAEPDLMVLAKQVTESTSLSSEWAFICVVPLGVGILFVLGILRIIFKLRLSILLAICYGAIFILSFFVPQSFVPIAFDSGSVTTGAISVPFIIAFGLGLSAVRSKQEEDDSFGLIALCSVGPIITVMILSLFLNETGSITATTVTTYSSIPLEIITELLSSLKEVAIILLPIVAMFLLFQIFSFKYPKTKVIRTLIGFLFTYLGISIFLTGVYCGYMPIGKQIGNYFSSIDNSWIAIPVGIVLGAFAIIAEPALHVLKKQVEDITNKTIRQKVIVIVVSIGVALSVGIAVMCSLFSINILYFIFPLYFLCIIFAFTNTKLFTAVSFDSGGVATGTMAVSFILPFVTGLSDGGSGFGTIALIAGFPVLTMQILGFIYKLKLNQTNKLKANLPKSKNYILEFDYEKPYIRTEIKNEVVEFDINS